MAQSIAANDPTINSHVPHQNDVCKRFRFLTKLKQKILWKYYGFRKLGIEKPDYSRHELAVFFGRHIDYLSTVLNEMEAEGLLHGEHGGSTNKKRWITCEAFSYLDTQQQGQISDQIESIPNIDLTELRSDYFKILKEEQVCGQIEEERLESDINLTLDNFLQQKKLPYQRRLQLKDALKRSRIGPVRTEWMITRMIEADKKKRIESVTGYFSASLRNERSAIESALICFRGKPNLKLNLYADF